MKLQEETFKALRGIGAAFIEDSEQLAEFNKKVALVELAVNTAKAISNVIAGATAAAAAGGPAAPFLIGGYIASGIATITSAIAQAKQLLGSAPTLSPPSLGGTGGGPSLPGGGVGQLPQVPETQINNEVNVNLPPIKAQVVETEVTESQTRVSTLEEAATVG